MKLVSNVKVGIPKEREKLLNFCRTEKHDIREISHDSLYSQGLKEPDIAQFNFTEKKKKKRIQNSGYSVEFFFSSLLLAGIKVDWNSQINM